MKRHLNHSRIQVIQVQQASEEKPEDPRIFNRRPDRSTLLEKPLVAHRYRGGQNMF